MLIGQYKHFPFSFSDSEVKNFAAVDMTNSLLLRTDENAINKIETAIISLGVQLLHELWCTSKARTQRNTEKVSNTVLPVGVTPKI